VELTVGPANGGVGFLLAQIGSHAASRFAERIATLDLTPPQAGLLRLLAVRPGRSQRELADALGVPPSRFVPFADAMEQRGIIERRRNPDDRRLHALYLTDEGELLLGRLRKAAMEHEQAMRDGLDPEEGRRLQQLLERVADAQGLQSLVHPGYRASLSGPASG
jgi:DNA-binding MarR family transcriptional regulator